MLIPKKNRLAVYNHLFNEGVMVAKLDYALEKHPDVKDVDVPNLQVIKLLQSLHSRGYVNKQFSWLYYYYYLTNEGIEYLREYLHKPAEAVPNTLKKAARPQRVPNARDEAPRGRFGGDRDGGYRRGPGGFGDKAGAGAFGGDRPRFVSDSTYSKLLRIRLDISPLACMGLSLFLSPTSSSVSSILCVF